MRAKDSEDWTNAHVDDLWALDKLILSKKLGYVCGPKGASVPRPGNYIVRPCSNFMGMGLGAEIRFIHRDTDLIGQLGTFWCEVFSGRHLSVDYKHGEQVFCAEGFRDSPLTNFIRWRRWEKTSDRVPYPEILHNLVGDYEHVNVEYIGGRIIEVHFRSNPDFRGHSSDFVIPIWKGDLIALDRQDLQFIERKDGDRLGFYIRRER